MTDAPSVGDLLDLEFELSSLEQVGREWGALEADIGCLPACPGGGGGVCSSTNATCSMCA